MNKENGKSFKELTEHIRFKLKMSDNIFDTLDSILEETLDMFNVSAGSISLSDPNEKILTIVASRGMDEEKKIAARFPYNVGITGYAASIQKTVYSPDVSKDKHYIKLIDSILSELAIPMIEAGETIGVLNFDSNTLDHFSTPQILQAEKIAEEIADALIKNNFYRDAFRKLYNGSDFLSQILGYDPQIIFLKSRIRMVAPSDASVFIHGESGTGKELVAKSLHSLSLRKKESFISVNCASLNENLLESELFGHVKGAYTGADRTVIGRFELANNGTIFLDEIGEMPLSLQVKLLRVLQEGEIEKVGDPKKIIVNVRVISATHKDLAMEVEKGNFRLDLYYRLGVIPLRVPPLRERRGDIPLLAHHYILEFNRRYGKNKFLSQEVLDIFTRHNWVGNVRELENAIQYSALLSPTDEILPESLPENILNPSSQSSSHFLLDRQFQQLNDEDLNLPKAIDELEIKYIQRALVITNSQEDAAKLLKISRGSLQYKIKIHRISINTKP